MTEERKVPCEVYSRVVGYMRPTSQWSEAKRLEFEERATFDRSVRRDEAPTPSGNGAGAGEGG